MKTAIVELYGLPLKVEYKAEWWPDDIIIEQIYLEGWEILSIMGDSEISRVRDKLLRGEGKEVQG